MKQLILAAALCLFWVPAMAQFTPAPQAVSSVPIATTATAGTYVLVSSAGTSIGTTGAQPQQIYVLHIDFMVSATTTVKFTYGTAGTTCATNPVSLTGAYPMTTSFLMESGLGGTLFVVPFGNDLCVVTGSNASVLGLLSYEQR